ncbi:hypothetical protein [Kitasatospora sp. MAP5-34]|uniref:hypothetical protein n=1 Tax=Kitasatospora sp. MAP5-34 TaxID=3035102 RepID=UPI0024767274|nr:hypothetical protein [Kitasatospora sp. MAP5-34]MDH6577258.1 hypothetical protein [Kitasatospora sp. MAP5-34]
MLRKTITTLALAAATLSSVLLAAPAQATVGNCINGPRSGERLCFNSYYYNRSVNLTQYTFTLYGPTTDYRVYAGSLSGPSDIRYPGNDGLAVDGHYGTTLCITEGTTGWRGCA